MSLVRLLQTTARSLHPSVSGLLLKDLKSLNSRPLSTKRHLNATMKWLCRAQDAVDGGGVSAGYSLLDGWLAPYPETTGYIIPTFFDYAKMSGQEEYFTRAVRMADWELAVQLPSGAIQAGLYHRARGNPSPAVFNTGQVILGWCRAFWETKNEHYLEAGIKAGNWLVSVQQPEGSWQESSPETETAVHAYDVRTAWALLELYQLHKDEQYVQASRMNLQWTMAQQRENGWFDNNAFFSSEEKWNLPLTHTIGYVLEGFQQAWRLLGEPRYLEVVNKTAERLLRIFELRRFMPGEFDRNWKCPSRGQAYSCLTGDAQIAGVWLHHFTATRDVRFLNAALKLNDFVKASQVVDSRHSGIGGGVKGSQPIYGRYTPFVFVNWGAKFLADALMAEESIMPPFEQAVRSRAKIGGESRV